MSIDPGNEAYSYEKATTRAVGHLQRYPRHYGALGLWLVAMVLLPTLGSEASPVTAAPVSNGTTATSAARAVGATASEIDGALSDVASAIGAPAPRPMSSAGSSPSSSGRGASSPGGSTATPTPAAPGDDGGEEDAPAAPETPVPVPATPELLEIPPPPAVPVPPVPEELKPLLAAVTPLTTQGCSAVGLAAVVAAVVGPTAGDAVPFAQLLPYLSPAYSASATFPAPEGDRTICAVDEQMRAAGYPADASGLAKTPNVIGLGVDVIAGFERAVASVTGQDLGLAAALGEALGCHPDAG